MPEAQQRGLQGDGEVADDAVSAELEVVEVGELVRGLFQERVVAGVGAGRGIELLEEDREGLGLLGDGTQRSRRAREHAMFAQPAPVLVKMS